MATFREVMSIIHTKSIVLHARAKSKPNYICNGWSEKDFRHLIKDFGDAEVYRVNFQTSYHGDIPEIFLDPDYQVKKE